MKVSELFAPSVADSLPRVTLELLMHQLGRFAEQKRRWWQSDGSQRVSEPEDDCLPNWATRRPRGIGTPHFKVVNHVHLIVITKAMGDIEPRSRRSSNFAIVGPIKGKPAGPISRWANLRT
jgi:hypothetical protein